MFGSELLGFSIRNLRHQKLRTGLTLLGIIIGIATIVAMLSIGTGLKLYTEEAFEKMGKNLIYVMPGGGMAGMAFAGNQFTQKDIDHIAKVRGVVYATGMYTSSGLVEYRDEKLMTFVSGVEPDKMETLFGGSQGYQLYKGRWPTERDRKSVLIGYLLATETLGRELGTRDSIIINGESYDIIGVIEEIGNSQDDNGVIMSLEDSWELFDADGQIYTIVIEVHASDDPAVIAERVERELEKTRDPETFSVATASSLLEQFGMFTTVLNIVLGGIAGISLVVGGIGIMNTMMMSVIERTREIGIMKALGATNRKVMQFFVVEAGLVGLAGGIIGIGLGTVVSRLVQFAAASAGVPLKNVVTFDLMFGAMAFAIIVGVLSGLYPAYRAAKLDPVEALRYE